MTLPGILLICASIWTPQGDIQPAGHTRDTTPGVETMDERVARESEAIRAAVQVFAEDEKNGLTPFLSDDGRIRVYTDFRAKDAKAAFKRVGLMFDQVDQALGYDGEDPEPLFAFLIARAPTYYRLCDTVAEAGPLQATFMQQSKETTGFTIFAPELTVYFHDLTIQEEARPDHSIGHNLIHLELHRRHGVLPLWIREGIATVAEDMATGEVWAPWHLNGFVFAASHGAWRGKETKEMVKDMKSVAEFDRIFEYSGKPYRNDLAHMTFSFVLYSMYEKPESLQALLTAMEELYAEKNEGKGGRPEFSLDDTRRMFHQAFLDSAEGEEKHDEAKKTFLKDFQKWWKKPPKWSKKPKKSKR